MWINFQSLNWQLEQQHIPLKKKKKMFLFFFYKENNAWYFMWIIYLADDSHETSDLIFSEN